MAIRTVKAAGLLLDYNLYPRHKIDDTHMRNLVKALQAGAVLPPVVVDQASSRVVDGFHRITAVLKKDGPDANIRADFRPYGSEGEMFLDAVRLNAAHGVRLNQWDRARVLAKAGDFQLTREQVTGALYMTSHEGERMVRSRVAEGPDGQPYPLKRASSHFAGTRLGPNQVEYNERAGGNRQRFYVDQVILMLRTESDDNADQGLHDALRELFGLLEARLTVKS